MYYDVETDHQSQVVLMLDQIRKVVPSITTFQSQTLYRFELVPKNALCSHDSERGTYEKYLNIRFENFMKSDQPNESAHSEDAQHRESSVPQTPQEIDQKVSYLSVNFSIID